MKGPGHEPCSDKHLKALSELPKHLVAAINQLRSSHIQLSLNQQLYKIETACACQTGIESPEHFLFICPRYNKQHKTLLTDQQSPKLLASTSVLNDPKAFPALATYCDATWRFKNHWVWADIIDKPHPLHLRAPDI